MENKRRENVGKRKEKVRKQKTIRNRGRRGGKRDKMEKRKKKT